MPFFKIEHFLQQLLHTLFLDLLLKFLLRSLIFLNNYLIFQFTFREE